MHTEPIVNSFVINFSKMLSQKNGWYIIVVIQGPDLNIFVIIVFF